MLPSLDRLSGLVERVVELVEAVGDAAPDTRPQAAPKTVGGGLWVAFVSSPHGYRLHDGAGAAPERGGLLELDGVPHRVLKIGPSPLPTDPRRCLYVEREEPQRPERTSDA